MPKVLWFKESYGLSIKHDASRLPYDEQRGVLELSESLNVNHDYTGALSRRLGYSATDIEQACHSLFWEGGECLFVTGDALCILAKDLTYKAIRVVTPGARVSYAQIGDATVYVNGTQKGVVKNGASYEWTKPDNVQAKDNTRVWSDPPLGEIVRLFAARAWVVSGNVIWYSEPFNYNLFQMGRNFIPFPNKITMLRPLLRGVYVSTTNMTYFLRGTNPKEMSLETVANYPAIAHTDLLVDGVSVNMGQFDKQICAMWTSVEGICLGTGNGEMINLTFDKIEYPKAIEGCALYTGDRYIVNLEP